MKRFYENLKNNNGIVDVILPSGLPCRIECKELWRLGCGPFGEPVFDVYIGGKHTTTLSQRWNWDDFVAEFKL